MRKPLCAISSLLSISLASSAMAQITPAVPVDVMLEEGATVSGFTTQQLRREGRINADTLKCAVIYGSAMASFVVERFGPERLLNLSDEAINDRIQAFQNLSAIPTIIPLVGISS